MAMEETGVLAGGEAEETEGREAGESAKGAVEQGKRGRSGNGRGRGIGKGRGRGGSSGSGRGSGREAVEAGDKDAGVATEEAGEVAMEGKKLSEEVAMKWEQTWI